jgi:hypothetical protein
MESNNLDLATYIEKNNSLYEKMIRTLEQDAKIIEALNEDADEKIKNNPIYNKK